MAQQRRDAVRILFEPQGTANGFQGLKVVASIFWCGGCLLRASACTHFSEDWEADERLPEGRGHEAQSMGPRAEL